MSMSLVDIFTKSMNASEEIMNKEANQRANHIFSYFANKAAACEKCAECDTFFKNGSFSLPQMEKISEKIHKILKGKDANLTVSHGKPEIVYYASFKNNKREESKPSKDMKVTFKGEW